MAGHSDTMRNDALTAVTSASGASFFGAHTADPGSSGSNEVSGGSYARAQAVPPSVTTVGTVTFPSAVLNIPIGVTVTHWARYKTASGGTPYDSGQFGAPVPFTGAPGTLTINLTTLQGA